MKVQLFILALLSASLSFGMNQDDQWRQVDPQAYLDKSEALDVYAAMPYDDLRAISDAAGDLVSELRQDARNVPANIAQQVEQRITNYLDAVKQKTQAHRAANRAAYPQ